MENEQLKQEAQKQFPNDSREIHMDGFHNGVEFQKQIDFNTQQYCKREGFVAGASFVSQNRDEEIAIEFAEWLDKCAYDGHEPDNFYRRQCDLFIESKKEGEAS